MQTVLYEDGSHRFFGPLTYLRPQFDLRCGALLLREKLEVRFPASKVVLLPRPELARVVAEQHPGRGIDALGEEVTLFLCGRVIVDDALLRAIADIPGEAIITSGDTPVGAVVRENVAGRAGAVGESLGDLGALGIEITLEVPARIVSYPWELVNLTGEEIAIDAPLVRRAGSVEGSVHPAAHLLEPANVAVGAGTEIGPGVVVDARHGPVLIGRRVTVMPNAVLEGPLAVGDDCLIKAGARIYEGTSIGENCKIGGEVEGSVFQGWSNKQHEGFLGHSYVGSWVNLGAATDNSDLKNNYGPVRVTIGSRTLDTGLTFVGSTIGDHAKTAIGTKLNTGTVVGVFANVVTDGFPPKAIPSFSWGTPAGFVEHDLARAVETARGVMARRKVEMTPAMESLIAQVFEATREERIGKPPA